MKTRSRAASLTLRQRFNALSLRRKLIILISSASVLVVILSVIAAFVIELAFFRNRLLKEYEATARMVAYNVGAAVTFKDDVEAREILDGLAHRDYASVVAAAVYQQNGQPLAAYRRSDAPPAVSPPPPTVTSELRGQTITASQPVVVDGFVVGHVALIADLSEMDSFLTARTGTVFTLVALAALLSVYLASRIGSRLSQPIVDLERTAQRISVERDYSMRQQRTSDDETGRLVDAFNKMMAEIEIREDAILKAKARAEASSKAKDDFLSVISHELRTPLNPIIGYVDVLLKKRGEPDDQKQLALVKQYAEHLQGLIDDILDYSRIERGVFAISEEEVDYQGLCQNVISLLAPQAQAKGLALASKHEFDNVDSRKNWLVRSDAVRLRQILLNLLSNAIKFTDSGSIELRTRLSVSENGAERLRVEVKDTGIGIGAADRGKVFKPFSQIDETLTRRHSGLGLGLAITRKIVATMEGEIDFVSEPGQGCLFWFEIPTRIIRPVQATKETATPAATTTKRGRVLLVDDQLVNRELGESLLATCGQEVVCAKDGFDALEKAKRESFSLIIMDIKMPKMDGYETTRKLRELEPEGERTPIIAMTAHVTASGSNECYASGMDDFLPKPFTAEKLNIILNKWLK